MKERVKIDPADYCNLTDLHIYLTQFRMDMTGLMVERGLPLWCRETLFIDYGVTRS